MGWLLKLLGSSLVGVFGDAILKPIMAHLDAKAGAQRDVSVAQIGADQVRDVALLQAEMRANEQRVAMADEFKALVYLTALPFVLHSGAVMLDSTFRFNWQVAAAPHPFVDWEGAILLSLFVASPATSLTKAIAARLTR